MSEALYIFNAVYSAFKAWISQYLWWASARLSIWLKWRTLPSDVLYEFMAVVAITISKGKNSQIIIFIAIPFVSKRMFAIDALISDIVYFWSLFLLPSSFWRPTITTTKSFTLFSCYRQHSITLRSMNLRSVDIFNIISTHSTNWIFRLSLITAHLDYTVMIPCARFYR